MPSELSVLVLCKDLLFSSQIHGVIQRSGRQGRSCLSQAGCLEQLASGNIQFVIIDLELPELNLAELKAVAGTGCRLIGYAPHVREDLFSAARAAGCDAVLTRGQTISRLEKLLPL